MDYFNRLSDFTSEPKRCIESAQLGCQNIATMPRVNNLEHFPNIRRSGAKMSKSKRVKKVSWPTPGVHVCCNQCYGEYDLDDGKSWTLKCARFYV